MLCSGELALCPVDSLASLDIPWAQSRPVRYQWRNIKAPAWRGNWWTSSWPGERERDKTWSMLITSHYNTDQISSLVFLITPILCPVCTMEWSVSSFVFFKSLLEKVINPGDCGWLVDKMLVLFSKLKRSNNCIKYADWLKVNLVWLRCWV